MTNIVLFLKIPTTLTNNTRCDTHSAYDLVSFLCNEINKIFTTVTETIHIDTIGNTKFTFSLDDIDEDDFRLYINAEAKIDYDDDDKLYELLSEDFKFAKDILKVLDSIISALNENLHLYVPYDETFIFTDDTFYIRMDPYYSVYKPEFKYFTINNSLDENDILENIYVGR